MKNLPRLNFLILVSCLFALSSCRREQPKEKNGGESKENYGYFLVDGKRNTALAVLVPLPSESDGLDWDQSKYEASRNKLTQTLTYVDGRGRQWHVPKDYDNDGASVPPFLHSVIPGGMNGYSYYPAIVHDFYCDCMKQVGKEPEGGYPAVHRMFFEALLCCKMDKRTASLMYLAVRKFGPPADRGVWARLLAEAQPEIIQKAAETPGHPVQDWLGSTEIAVVRGFPRVVDGDTSRKLEEESSTIAQATKVAEQARNELESLKTIAEQLSESIGGNVSLAGVDEGGSDSGKDDEELRKTAEALREQANKLNNTIEASSAQKKASEDKIHEIESKAVTDSSDQAEKVRKQFDLLCNKVKEMREEDLTLETLDELIDQNGQR